MKNFINRSKYFLAIALVAGGFAFGASDASALAKVEEVRSLYTDSAGCIVDSTYTIWDDGSITQVIHSVLC